MVEMTSTQTCGPLRAPVDSVGRLLAQAPGGPSESFRPSQIRQRPSPGGPPVTAGTRSSHKPPDPLLLFAAPVWCWAVRRRELKNTGRSRRTEYAIHRTEVFVRRIVADSAEAQIREERQARPSACSTGRLQCDRLPGFAASPSLDPGTLGPWDGDRFLLVLGSVLLELSAAVHARPAGGVAGPGLRWDSVLQGVLNATLRPQFIPPSRIARVGPLLGIVSRFLITDCCCSVVGCLRRHHHSPLPDIR